MTLKAIALMPRRPDFTRAAFRDYYESWHTPLALQFFQFNKYVRNHLLDHDELGFDCVSEFWPTRADGGFSLMQTEIGERMRVDERKFTDQPNIRALPCDEVLLAGPARTGDDTDVHKEARMLKSALDAETLIARLRPWAEAQCGDAAQPLRRVTLDRLLGEHAAFGFDALLWLWPAQTTSSSALSELPAGIDTLGSFRVQPIETAAEILARTPEYRPS